MNDGMKEIALADANKSELAWHAKAVMGLEVAGNAKEETIRAKIKEAGWEKTNISVPVKAVPLEGTVAAPDDVKPAPQKVGNLNSGKNDKKLVIFIPNQDGPGGDRAVSVGVNGTHILIPREQECEVALRYVEVLKHAVQTEYTQNEDTYEILSREVLLTPFTIISGREHLAA